MRASKDIHFSRPFVMTPDDLTKLGDIIESFSTIRSIKLSCADKADREFYSIADLLKFENPPNKAITALRILTTSKGKDLTSLYLRLDTDSMRNINYSIEGEEPAVLDFLDKFEERLSAMKPWYALVADTGFKGIIVPALIGWVALMVITNAGVRFAVSKSWLAEKTYSYTQLLTAIVIMLVIGTFIQIIIIKLRGSMFPNGVFALGQGMKRHQDKEIYRQVVIFGFAIEIIGGIILTLFL